MSGTPEKQHVHLKSYDGVETFTNNKSVMAKCSEYFRKLFKIPEALENLQQHGFNTALDEKPTMDEVVRVIKGLKDGKTPGGDEIPVDVWKYSGANVSNRLHRWMTKIWEDGHLPQSWKDVSIVTIYQKMSDVYIFFPQPARSLLGSY